MEAAGAGAFQPAQTSLGPVELRNIQPGTVGVQSWVLVAEARVCHCPAGLRPSIERVMPAGRVAGVVRRSDGTGVLFCGLGTEVPCGEMEKVDDHGVFGRVPKAKARRFWIPSPSGSAVGPLTAGLEASAAVKALCCRMDEIVVSGPGKRTDG